MALQQGDMDMERFQACTWLLFHKYCIDVFIAKLVYKMVFALLLPAEWLF